MRYIFFVGFSKHTNVFFFGLGLTLRFPLFHNLFLLYWCSTLFCFANILLSFHVTDFTLYISIFQQLVRGPGCPMESLHIQQEAPSAPSYTTPPCFQRSFKHYVKRESLNSSDLHSWCRIFNW